MIVEQIETVIIGGGQAGLAMSYYLGQLGREHIVLERARVAERWRSERWDSLAFQSPNWNIHLPGFAFQAADPDAFASRDEIVQFGHIRTSDAIQFDSSVCRTLSFMMSSPNPSRQAISRRCRLAASVDRSDA